ncbi:hypothetical protein GCM10010339_08540 [Streptomyces alanosinicus]|uniref:Uncharacterized protein n=1 Tax=Streptomyces alanosinicus TaxID=68171 RepID=A0A919D036_9ACTN|nr:hypothetical protein GCM10010339_08540 [Streptomyces alanosinicus]
MFFEREEMGMEGARGARRRAFYQSTVAEDRARVHHASGQGFALRRLTVSRHVDDATVRTAEWSALCRAWRRG